MADPVKYKYGRLELDLGNYLDNLSSNVNSYMKYHLDKGLWNNALAEEFQNAYTLYSNALLEQLTSGNQRFHTDEFGKIWDSLKLIGAEDDDKFFYDNKGNLINENDYNSKSKRKLGKYQAFNSHHAFANFAKKVADGILKMSTAPVKEATAYDQAKHGFGYWWNNVKHANNGGKDLTPYINVDKFENGERKISKRPGQAAGWFNEYNTWLLGQNLDWSNDPIGKNTRSQRLTDLATSWGDTQWEDVDLQKAYEAGIDKNWLDMYLSTAEDPNLTKEQIAAKKASDKAAAEQAASAEEAAKKQKAIDDIKAANDQYVKSLWDLYEANKGQYHYTSPTRYNIEMPTFTESEDMPARLAKAMQTLSSDPTERVRQIQNFFNNPFLVTTDTNAFNRHKNILYMLLNDPNQERVRALSDGSMYLMHEPDIAKGRALVYDPQYRSLEYRFIGEIPDVWEDLKRRNFKPETTEESWRAYRKEGGVIPYMQSGGGFDYGAWADRVRQSVLLQQATAHGTTVPRQEARNRQVNTGVKGVTQSDFMNLNNRGFTDVEKARLAGAGADIISMISAFAPGYGTAVSAISGFGSTFANAYADVKDSGLSGSEALKNFGVNLGMDLLGLIPEAGAASKATKIVKNIGNLGAKLMAGVGAMSAFANKDEIMASLGKLTRGETMNVGDWQNVVQAISVTTGLSTGAIRHATRNADAYNTKGIDRRAALIVDDKVVVEFTNKKTKATEQRVFSGEDARAIRAALESKDIAALRRATTEKYEDLSGYDVSTHGKKPTLTREEGKWLPKWGLTAGTPIIYDVVTHGGKTYVKRGTNGAFDYTSDIPDVSKVRTTNGRTIAEADNIIKLDKDIASAMHFATAKANAETNVNKLKESIKKKVEDKKKEIDQYKTSNPTITPGSAEETRLNELQSQLATLTNKLTKINNFDLSKIREKSRARERLEGRLNPDGTLTIDVAGGDPIIRDWNDIMKKFNVLKEGGKISFFEEGGKHRNVMAPKGPISWQVRIFNHPSMLNYFNSMDVSKPETWQEFNRLQDWWQKNLEDTGYLSDLPDMAYSHKQNLVGERLKKWNETGVNAAIGDLQAEGSLVGHNGSNDNAAGGYVDNIFGRQEYLRHGGTRESWEGYEEELLNFIETMKAKGFDYTLQSNGMYHLYPTKTSGQEAPKPNVESAVAPEKVAEPGDPGTRTSEVAAGPKVDITPKDDETVAKQVPYNLEIPKDSSASIYGAARLFAGLNTNRRITDNAVRAVNPDIYSDPETFLYQLSSIWDEQEGKDEGAKIEYLGSQPITSDGQLASAMRLEAAVKARQYVNEGMRKSNDVSRATAEKAFDRVILEKERRGQRHISNLKSIADAAEERSHLRDVHDNRTFEMWDAYAQEQQLAALKEQNEKNAALRNYLPKIIHENIVADLGQYTDVSDDELKLWEQYNLGAISVVDLQKDPEKWRTFQKVLAKANKVEELLLLQRGFGINVGAYSNVRTMAQHNTSDDWTGTYTLKSGGSVDKIAVQRLRNRSKDEDRFHKNINKKWDRSEKALDRVAKYGKKNRK